MAAKVRNIGRDQKDASYRYKMPVLIPKVEGSGNGIKTVLVNIGDIAKALKVDPRYPTKYFGIELGAQTIYDTKFDPPRAIVNGAFNLTKLSALLDDYVDKFVLCPNCRLPELIYSVKSKVTISCNACGHKTTLPEGHKLVKYMINNPPAKKGKQPLGAITAGATTAGGKREKGKKGGKDEKEDGSEDAGTDATSGDATTDSASKAEDGLESKEDKPKKEKPVSTTEDTWFSDTSEAGQEQRKKEALAEMKAANKAVDTIVAKAEKKEKKDKEAPKDKTESAVQVMRGFMEKEHSVDEIVAELRRVQISRELDDQTNIKVLLDSMIDVDKEDAKKAVPLFGKKAKLFAKFTGDATAKRIFLYCLEEYVGLTQALLVKYTSKILQLLYEADVLDESSILSWYDSPPESSWLVKKDVAARVRKHAAKFAEWLRTADEEEEDE